MEPTDDQLEGFGSLRDIVMYVRGRVPEEIETLVVAMGASLDSAPTLLSRISDTEIEGAMSLVLEMPILVKSVVPQVLHICRLKGNCVARLGAVAAAEARGPAAPLAVAQIVACPSGINRFKLSSVANQASDVELTVLEGAVLKGAYATYKKVFGVHPAPDEELSGEQLTALKVLLSADLAPYVDFAVWGPHSYRLLRKHRLSGVSFTRDGSLVPIELSGPATFDQWLKNFKCLRTGLISWGAVSLGRLDGYSDMISRYHSRYGPSIWHVLYQADVRCRSEHMERVRRRGEEESAVCAAAHGVHAMEADRPWDWVFGEVLRDSQFWHLEVEEPSLLLLNRTRSLGDLLTGEAPVGDAGKRQAAGKTGEEPRLKKPKGEAHHNVDGNLFTTNRKNYGLCAEYQDGTCISDGKSNHCPRTTGMRHQCARCLAPNHGASACPRADYPATQAKGKGKKGGDKGKGKSKGKKGDRWQY
jgi:hypothetical protein